MKEVVLYPETKVCSRCHVKQPIENFHRDGQHHRKSQCANCRSKDPKKNTIFYPEIRERIGVLVPQYRPLEMEAFDEAVYRLIEIYPSKFRQLLFSERVSRGLAEPLPYEPTGTRKKIPA